MSVSSNLSTGQVPRVTGTILRPRLIARLQAALDHKLTIISAPPGYGKTTVAAQFARQVNTAVAWHTVEERERDVPNLYGQFVSILSQVLPSAHALASVADVTPHELAINVATHLRKHLAGELVYVMDDVQNLAGSPAAEAWLRTFVTALPSKCHLVLVSRILPDLPLTEMIARREVLAIGQQELQFTSHEINQFAYEVLGASKPPGEVNDLAVRLEGWPAGIVLALQPLPPDLERAMLSGGKGPEALFDALASFMLAAQTPGMRNFLLASSTLARLTPDLCANALNLPDAAYWLEETQNRSLFLTKVSGGLVYHALFRNFLQRELKQSDPQHYARLHSSAACWFEMNNRIDEAFDHYVAADQMQDAAAIAERVAQSYFIQGKLETLLNWSSKLTPAWASVPRLLMTCAMIHTDRYDYGDAESKLTFSEKGFALGKDRAGQVSAKLQRAMISLQKGHYGDAIAQAQHLLDTEALTGNFRARALNTVAVARLRQGETEAAILCLEEAIPLYRADGDAYALSQSLQNLDAAYTRLGRLDEAGACLQEVVALRRSLNSAGSLALALNNLGYYYHLRSNYRQATATLQEGLSVAARVPDRRAESYLLWSLGDLQRDKGAFDDAQRLYDKALELLGASEPSLRSSILVSASILRRWQGHYANAIVLAEEANALSTRFNIGLERTVSQAMIWGARAFLGEAQAAKEKLAPLVENVQSQGARFELLRVLGIASQVSLLASDKAGARQYLQRALQMSQSAGSSQPFTAEVFHSPLLHTFATEQPWLSGLVRQELSALLDAQAKSITSQRLYGAMTAQGTYNLRVLTLGQESIERDGKPISMSDWRATSAREMFLYLLFNGAQTREGFSLTFWPDSSVKQVRSNFHTTLYRARQALGENVIVFYDDLYFINPDVECTADAAEMKQLAAQARLMPPRDARTEDLWRHAAHLYRGDFLPSLDDDWVLPLREQFQELYIEALVGVGACARARGDLREAVSAYKRALRVDPYREDIHRAILTCYGQKGEKKKIAHHLQQLQELLWQELAVKPSAETVALARSLLH